MNLLCNDSAHGSPRAADTEGLRTLVGRVLAGQRLKGEQASIAIDLLCEPGADVTLQVALLAGLRARGETAAELADLTRALLQRAKGPVTAPPGVLLDTCGTGGDGSNSVNISTLSAIVAAAVGITVAKHGNRAVSGRSGSADLVAALGLQLESQPQEAARTLERDGFAFLLAPAFHPAAANLVRARRALGTRTVFNLLGPLANPARPSHQVLGAADPASARLMAAALVKLGVQRAFVVHGTPGWDEATPCGPFLCLDVRDGMVRTQHLDPGDYGLPRCSPSALAGGDIARNTALAEAFLAGELGPIRDAVLLNTALALQVTGRESAPRAALALAAAAVDEGHAARLVSQGRERARNR